MGYVDYVEKHVAFCGFIRDLPVYSVVVSGGNGYECAFQVSGTVFALKPVDPVVASKSLHAFVDLWTDDYYLGVIFQQFDDLFLANVPTTDDYASAVCYIEKYRVIGWHSVSLDLRITPHRGNKLNAHSALVQNGIEVEPFLCPCLHAANDETRHA